jgi:hypothetical protein
MDNVCGLRSCSRTIPQEPVDRVESPYLTTLYIDLEGVNLSRHGTVSIATLLISDGGFHPDRVNLVDIHTRGSSAFTTPVGASAVHPRR